MENKTSPSTDGMEAIFEQYWSVASEANFVAIV